MDPSLETNVMSIREKKQPICVTGGSGFIGTHLIRNLLSRGGERQLTVIDLHEPAPEVARDVRFFQGSYADPTLLRDALAERSVLVHLGGTSNQATSEKNHLADVDLNIRGTLELLNVAAERNIEKILFMSSAPAVYGAQQRMPIRVTATPNPISAHGIMKLAVEQYIRHYARNHGFAFMNLRCVNIYGPGQLAESHGVVSRFAANVLAGKPIELWGSPNVSRDFLYVDDFIEALYRCMQPQVRDVTLNVASGTYTTLGDLISVIERATGKTATVLKRDLRAIDTRIVRLDTKETERILGWKANVPIEVGVQNTIAWLRQSNSHLA